MNCFRHYVVGAENGKVFFSLMGCPYGKREEKEAAGCLSH